MSENVAKSTNLHHIKMAETPVPKLVISLAIPAIVSMLITSIYNTADTFFVSRLGTSATGAVSVVFPLMSIVQSIAFMIGMGSGNLVAQKLGGKKQEEASKIASTGFFTCMAFGILFALFGTIFTPVLVNILGATQTIKPFAIDYAFYICFAAPFMCCSFVMNNILRGEGKSKLSMIGITFGGILNIILDPIFIFVLELGVSGAAIATAISQFVSFSILLLIFITNKSSVKLHLKYIDKDPKTLMKILSTGLPSFFRQGSSSLAIACTNWQARIYGDAALAAIGINSRIFFLLYSILLGIGQGLQPVAGFSYGAKLYGRVKKTLNFTIKVSLATMLCVSVLGFVFAESIVGLFATNDSTVISIGSFIFRAQCIVLVLHGLCLPLIMALQCTGQIRASSFLSLCRQFICFMPIILILPFFFGLFGVQIAQPIADILWAALSIPFYISFIRQLTSLENIEKSKKN